MTRKSKIYAVKQGRSTGIFKSWEECKTAIEGYSGARYKSFESVEEAEAFLNDIDIVMNNDVLPRVEKGNMSNTELKVIRAAIRSTRDLIQTLNVGREMPSQLAKIFFELNDDAIILSGMIEED